MEATMSDNTQMKTVVYDDAIVRAFSIITIVWGVVALLVGVILHLLYKHEALKEPCPSLPDLVNSLSRIPIVWLSPPFAQCLLDLLLYRFLYHFLDCSSDGLFYLLLQFCQLFIVETLV